MAEPIQEKDNIKNTYIKLKEKLGRQPGNREFYKETGISEYQITKHFLKYSLLVKEMGGIEKTFGEQYYPENQYWESYGVLIRQLQKLPTRSEWQFYECKPLVTSYTKRFKVKWSELPILFFEYAADKDHWSDILHFAPSVDPKHRVKTSIAETPEIEFKYAQFIPPVLNEFIGNSFDGEKAIIFEKQVTLLFQMLGFESNNLGQGTGRNPDCIAKASQFNYAILIDAKSREQHYKMGTEDRKFIEYIKTYKNLLSKTGHNLLYFLVVSSEFNSEYSTAITNIKRETGVETSFIKASTLLILLAKKIEHPSILTIESLKELFISQGLITDAQLEKMFKANKIY